MALLTNEPSCPLHTRALHHFFAIFLSGILFSSAIIGQTPQRLSYSSYTVAEGLVSNLVTDIALDANGFLWISTATGVQRFDGKTFHTILQSNDDHGIHYDKNVHFMPLESGELLITTPGGVVFYNPVNNQFRNVLIAFSKEDEEDISLVPIKEEVNNIWLMNHKKIFLVEKKSGTILSELSTPGIGTLDVTPIQRQLDDERFCILTNRATVVSFDTKLKLLKPICEAADQSIDNFHILNRDSLLLVLTIGMEIINIQTGRVLGFYPFPAGEQNTDYSRTVSLELSPNIFLVGVNNQLWEFDVAHHAFTRRLTDIHDQPFISANLYSKLIRDRYDNIWAASYIQGLRKIHYQSPAIKYFGAGENENNFVKCVYADKKNNLVLCGMFNHGLQVYDTNQRLLKNFPEFEKDNPQPTVAAIEKINDNEYLLFPQHSYDLRIFNARTLTLSKASSALFPFQAPSYNYYFNCFRVNDSSFLGSFKNVLYRFVQSNNTIHADSMNSEPGLGSFYTFQRSNGDIWLGHMGKYSISHGPTKSYSFYPIGDNVMVRCITEDQQHFVWMATEKGLYKAAPSGQIIKQYTKKDGLPDDGIYAVVADDNGNVWFSHNKGLSRMSPNGSLFNLSKEDGLQEKEFNTNCVFKTKDGELFFGGVNGVNSFFPTAIRSTEQPVQLLMTSVSANGDELPDTSFWNLSSLSFSHSYKALKFDMVAEGNRNPDQYIYQYKLGGLHDKWINNGNNPSVQLLLSPGEYDLQLAAGDEFDENAVAKKQIHIIIRPPFWKTTWFFGGAVLLLGIIIWRLALYSSRKKLREKMRQVETEKKIQQERERISRDLHDNLGSQATAIYYSAGNMDEGKTNQEILASIKTTSQQMLSSLRETIWAMNKEEMSVAEVSDRLKLFILQLNRHYPNVKVHMKENISGDSKLSSEQSLQLLRILQEAVNNAFKHAGASNIYCEIADTDRTIVASVKDDGMGIQKTKTDGFVSGGDGMVNMQERARAANMKLEIGSGNGQGTTIRVLVRGHEN